MVTVVVPPIMFSPSVFCKETPYLKTTIAQTSIELNPGFDVIKRKHRTSTDNAKAVIVLKLFTTDFTQRKTLPRISSIHFALFLRRPRISVKFFLAECKVSGKPSF